MRTIALCENAARATGLWRRLRSVDGVELTLLVPNYRRRPLPLFVAAQAAHLLRGGRLAGLRLLATRRLRFARGDLDSERTLAWIRAREPDVGLHAVGVIYRAPLLESFRLGVLNPHIGILPRYRGRSVMEWSILHGDPTGITTFFMDTGIDTGERIVLREEVDVSAAGSVEDAKNRLFALDAEMYARALERLQDPGFEPLRQRPEDGTRWYVMSGLLTGVVAQLLGGSGEPG